MLLNTFGFKVGLAHFSNQSLGLVKIRPIVMIHKVGFGLNQPDYGISESRLALLNELH